MSRTIVIAEAGVNHNGVLPSLLHISVERREMNIMVWREPLVRTNGAHSICFVVRLLCQSRI